VTATGIEPDAWEYLAAIRPEDFAAGREQLAAGQRKDQGSDEDHTRTRKDQGSRTRGHKDQKDQGSDV
jgi:hypothetical protein